MRCTDPYIWRLMSSEVSAISSDNNTPKTRASKIIQFQYYTTDAPI